MDQKDIKQLRSLTREAAAMRTQMSPKLDDFAKRLGCDGLAEASAFAADMIAMIEDRRERGMINRDQMMQGLAILAFGQAAIADAIVEYGGKLIETAEG